MRKEALDLLRKYDRIGQISGGILRYLETTKIWA